MNSIASRVRAGSLWVAGSRGVINGLGLLSTLALARLLMPADFGLVAIGTTIVAIVGSMTTLSLSQAIIHHDAPDHRHLSCVWTLSLLRGLILALLLAGSAPFVADFYGDPRLTIVMFVVAGSTLFSGLANPRLAMLKRDLHFWQDFVIQTSSKLAQVAVAISLAYFYRSYVALLGGLVTAQVIGIVVSYLFVPFLPRFRLKEARELFGFTGWLTLGEIVRTLNFRLDPLIIGKLLGSQGLGLFTVAQNLAEMSTREATQPLTATLFPAFRRVRDDPDRLRNAYTRAQTMVSAIGLPSGVLMALLAEPLILLAMGEKWSPAIVIVQVLAVTFGLGTMTLPQPVAMATGHTKLIFKRALQALWFRLPIVVTGLYFDGMRGLLIARVILTFTSEFLNMLVVKQVTGLGYRKQILPNWRTLASCGAMALIVILMNPILDMGPQYHQLALTIAITGLFAGSIYVSFMLGLWVVAGKPNGPEKEIWSIASGTLNRFVAGRSVRKGN